jgi:hypothetical protein
MVSSAGISVTLPPQLSVAVGVANSGVAGHWIVDVAGNVEITGGTVSFTLMICDADEVFPQASIAVQVRVMIDEPAHAPGVVTSFGVSVTALPQASVAVGVAKTGVSPQAIVLSAGRAEITGAVVSVTVIDCEALATFPQASVAVHVRVITYEPAQAPGTVTSFGTSVTSPPQLSVAVGWPNTGAVVPQLTVELAGTPVITGGTASLIVSV